MGHFTVPSGLIKAPQLKMVCEPTTKAFYSQTILPLKIRYHLWTLNHSFVFPNQSDSINCSVVHITFHCKVVPHTVMYQTVMSMDFLHTVLQTEQNEDMNLDLSYRLDMMNVKPSGIIYHFMVGLHAE